MAVNYSNYPQYRAAVAKAQELSTQLYGTSDNKSLGLASKMNAIAAAQGENSTEYKAVKARFDALQKEHKAASAAADAMRKEIDKAEGKKSEVKEAAKQKSKDSETVATLLRERDSLKRQNKLEEAKAKQAQIDAIKRPPAVDSEGNEVVTADTKFSEYTLNGDGTITGKDGKPVVFVETRLPNGDVEAQAYGSKASARDAFLKSYQDEGGIARLQKQLLASKYIKESEIKDGTWYKGLDDMLIAYSVKAVSDVKYGGVKQPEGIQAFIGRQRGGTATGGPKSYKTITTRGEAKKLIDDYYSDLLGRAATPEESDAFYNQLHTAENAAVAVVKDGVTTGSTLADADRLLIAARVARNSLRGTKVEELLKSGRGSTAATDIAKLQETAANYGVIMSPADALGYVANGVGQKDYLAKQEERIRQVAIQLHPNLEKHFAAGGTYKDITDQYAYVKKNKLGVPVQNSTTDKDITDAVSKGMSLSDFNRAMQGKEEWRFTDEAHAVANDYAQKILSSFGFGG